MSDLKDTQYLDGIWFNYRGDHEAGRESVARDDGRGAPLPAVGSQRHLRGQPDDATVAVPHSVDCAAGAALAWWAR